MISTTKRSLCLNTPGYESLFREAFDSHDFELVKATSDGALAVYNNRLYALREGRVVPTAVAVGISTETRATASAIVEAFRSGNTGAAFLALEDFNQEVENYLFFEGLEARGIRTAGKAEFFGQLPMAESQSRSLAKMRTGRRPQIVEGEWWKVDTASGIHFLHVSESDGTPESFEGLLESVYETEKVSGHGARMRRGNDVCTPWEVFEDVSDARQYLHDTYGSSIPVVEFYAPIDEPWGPANAEEITGERVMSKTTMHPGEYGMAESAETIKPAELLGKEVNIKGDQDQKFREKGMPVSSKKLGKGKPKEVIKPAELLGKEVNIKGDQDQKFKEVGMPVSEEYAAMEGVPTASDLMGTDYDYDNPPEHTHDYGDMETSRFTGTPTRGCILPGCKSRFMNFDDDEDEGAYESDMHPSSDSMDENSIAQYMESKGYKYAALSDTAVPRYTKTQEQAQALTAVEGAYKDGRVVTVESIITEGVPASNPTASGPGMPGYEGFMEQDEEDEAAPEDEEPIEDVPEDEEEVDEEPAEEEDSEVEDHRHTADQITDLADAIASHPDVIAAKADAEDLGDAPGADDLMLGDASLDSLEDDMDEMPDYEEEYDPLSMESREMLAARLGKFIDESEEKLMEGDITFRDDLVKYVTLAKQFKEFLTRTDTPEEILSGSILEAHDLLQMWAV